MTKETLHKAKQLQSQIILLSEQIRQVERIHGREKGELVLGVVWKESENTMQTLESIGPEALFAAVSVILCDLKNQLSEKEKELAAL